MTSVLLLLSAVCLDPREDVVDTRVDWVEINHYWSESNTGDRPTFIQIIFWQWTPHGREVLAWRIVSRDFSADKKVFYFMDGKLLRKVRTSVPVYKTWTYYDREVEERCNLDQHNRKGLPNK